MPLSALWACMTAPGKYVGTLPLCIVVCCSTVYEVAGEGFFYSRLTLSDVGEPVQAPGAAAGKYFLRAYIQHRHRGQPSGTSRVGGHYVAHVRNQRLWYVADDTATTLRRDQPHVLPALFFFENVQEIGEPDLPLVDLRSPSRAPAWMSSVLEVFSALQVDSEWLLGLSEEDQITVAEMASSQRFGPMMDGSFKRLSLTEGHLPLSICH